MAESPIAPHPEATESAFLDRVSILRDRPVRDGNYVLYWMQQSQRAATNHALEYAIGCANELRVPVLVCFVLMRSYPEASARAYQFMLEGLAETAQTLTSRGIGFTIEIGAPPGPVIDRAREAVLAVCDRGYLSPQRAWREALARQTACRLVEVESDLIVPVEAATDKREYAARTIRPRIHRVLDRYIVPLESRDPRCKARDLVARNELTALLLDRRYKALLARLEIPDEPPAVSWLITGGYSPARARLDSIRGQQLLDYEDRRSDPGTDIGSGLSPYLHFGQISALEIALELDGEQYGARVSARMRPSEAPWITATDAFLEQLIVRRELAHNYCWFEPRYARYEALPQWAKKTLGEHASDQRPATYTVEELERAQTHDEYWNAAMREMLLSGAMHNYMRMYWGKKILEWSATPEEAYSSLLELNNRYFIDGRDPNSYANVGWIFGLHDRPWTERSVYGKVRSMTAKGLDRKFTMERYLDRIADLESRALEAQ